MLRRKCLAASSGVVDVASIDRVGRVRPLLRLIRSLRLRCPGFSIWRVERNLIYFSIWRLEIGEAVSACVTAVQSEDRTVLQFRGQAIRRVHA